MTLCHRLSSIVCAVAIAIATLEAQQLPTASPQSQGLAPERLERLHAFLTEEIDEVAPKGVAAGERYAPGGMKTING